MNTSPAISVVMSVYKESLEWLHESIDSILNQTYKNFEFIIICDNPQYQEGINLLKEYENKDKRLKILYNDENIGLTKSLNKGLFIAQGEYIARMDADDISRNDRLQRQYEYMESHPEVDVCGSNCIFIGEVKYWGNRCFYLPESHEEIVACMLYKNPIAHPTAFMKRIIKGDTFSYDESKKKAQDYQLWYDLKKRGATFYNIQENLLNYRISSSQISLAGRSDQNLVSNSIHEDILVDNGCKSQLEIIMHNEICNFQRSDIPVDDKLKWLNRIYNSYKNLNSNYLRDLYLFYSCQVCFKNKKPFKVFSIKDIKSSVFGKVYFYKGFIASFIK